MRKDVSDTDTVADETEGMRELIRVKIDIEGLTEEDIQYLRNQSACIISERSGTRMKCQQFPFVVS